MLKKILLALALILVVFVIVVALLPANFRVTRSATFNAPAETVFAQVNDFHKWDVWSPWAKLDPNAKTLLTDLPPVSAQSWRGRATRMWAKAG